MIVLTSFRCCIGKLAHGRSLHHTGYGGNVNDRAGVAWCHFATFREQGQECRSAEILTSNVGIECLCPFGGITSHQVVADGLSVFEVGCAVRGEASMVIPSDARVVDQEMDSLRLLACNLIRDALHIVLYADITPADICKLRIEGVAGHEWRLTGACQTVSGLISV